MSRDARGQGACDAVQARLTEAFFAREAPGAGDLAHGRTCKACAAHRNDLRALAATLDCAPGPDLSPAVLAATQRRARAALAEAHPTAVSAAPHPTPVGAAALAQRSLPELPRSFRRELLRLVAASLAPLPIVLLWNAALVLLAERFLTPLLPGLVMTALGLLYGLALTTWLTVLYGSLPILAYRRSLRLSQGHRHV